MATKKRSKKKTGPVVKGWHFLPADRCLKNGDGRLVKDGETVEMHGNDFRTPTVCGPGLHASSRPSQAADYHCGPVLTYVEVWGDIDGDPKKDDKFCGRYRKILWSRSLSAAELKALIKKSGGQSYGDDTVADLVDYLTSGDHKKLDAAIIELAIQHGCPVVMPPPQPVLKELTDKAVYEVMSTRRVMSIQEIHEALKGHDFDPNDDYNGDEIEALSERLNCCERVLSVGYWDQNNKDNGDGYVLAVPQKKKRRR